VERGTTRLERGIVLGVNQADIEGIQIFKGRQGIGSLNIKISISFGITGEAKLAYFQEKVGVAGVGETRESSLGELRHDGRGRDVHHELVDHFLGILNEEGDILSSILADIHGKKFVQQDLVLCNRGAVELLEDEH